MNCVFKYVISAVLLYGALFFISSEVSAELSKSDYTLFHPTPRDQMREFATDRPDKTESPYSVDAGHFQHETDIANVVFNDDDGSREDSFLFAAPNLKVGLTNNSDLQVVAQSYVYSRTASAGDRSKASGYGDTLVRLKINLWGNDSGETAFAVMPYVKFPTARGDLSNNAVEGGLILPFAFSVDDFGFGLMSQIDILREDGEDGRYVSFVNSATVGTDLTDSLGGYMELWTNINDREDFQMTYDIGLTYSPIEDLQLDAGVNIGLTDASDDWNPFVGFSQRF